MLELQISGNFGSSHFERYIELLKDHCDVVSTSEKFLLTGYGTTSINKWCSKGGVMKTIFEQTGGNYIRQGDYLLPDLKYPKKSSVKSAYGGERRR